MIAPNTVVGNRYRVLNPLGGGGMKLVYLAEDLRLAARRCALAEMVDSFTDLQAQQAALVSFQREADMLAQLNNEHIPRIYDRFSEQNHHYLVMEYVEGETLEQLLEKSGGRLDENQVVDIALQILDTLEYLHNLEPPVIYRDLKPSNVMLTSSGKVKLVDFGIARFFQPQGNATLIGTQGYSPPEQYRGKVERCSDLYSLGATMHHLLSGRDPASEPPFSFPPLEKLCPRLDPLLAALVNHALSYEPQRRIQSAAEFKARLLAIKESSASLRAPAPAVSAASDAGLADAQAAPASAPTVRIKSSETVCPACGRLIPADSSFCSYCAADLRLVLGAAHLPSSPSPSDASSASRGLEEPAAAMPRPDQFHRVVRRKKRRPLMGFVAMIVLGVLVLRVLPQLFVGLAAIWLALMGGHEEVPGPEARVPPPVEAPETSPADALRAFALRRVLDGQGYTSVHFKVHGQSVDLWGSVPSEADRLQIEATAFAITGAVTLSDHIKVDKASSGAE
jgi:serine/threonine protein kinase